MLYFSDGTVLLSSLMHSPASRRRGGRPNGAVPPGDRRRSNIAATPRSKCAERGVAVVPGAGLRIVLSLNGTGDKNQLLKPLVLSICGGQLSIVTRIWFCDWFWHLAFGPKRMDATSTYRRSPSSGHFDILPRSSILLCAR